MNALTRKLLRDLRYSIGILLSIVAIIAVGTGEYIGLSSSQRMLSASQQTYYNTYRFGDFWIDVKKAPLTAVEPIAQMAGVADINTRVIFDVMIDLPDESRPLSGRLISTPPRDYDRTINGICIIRGSGFSDDRNEEVIVSDAFARAHALEPGDHIQLILNRKRQSFVIVGTALSPEYVYLVRGEGDMVPDAEHFGVLYVKERFARETLDFQDACNQIVGQLTPGSDVDVDALLENISSMLTPYGVMATTPRDRQASHRFLSDEIQGLKTFSIIAPGIFLTVAALVLNILMVRLAERQRTIIGTLKAIGYSNRQIMAHFLWFGVIVGVVGGLAGCVLGVSVAFLMKQAYEEFFEFPEYIFQIAPDLPLLAIGISIAFALAGTIKGVYRMLKLSPAEAMRPAPPERGGAMWLERFPMIWRRMSFRTHMALRSVARHRGRTSTAVVSTGLGISIMILALCMQDSMFFMMDYQFDQVVHSSADIGLRNEAPIAALYEARELTGVSYAEPVFGLHCDLRNGLYSRRIGITGLTPEHQLTTPMQEDFTPTDIPDNGLVMSRKLATLLNARIGDELELTPIRGRREPVFVPLTSITDTFVGLECYADINYLSRVVGEHLAVNSVQLLIDPPQQNAFYAQIKSTPNAQGLSVRTDAREVLQETVIDTSRISLTILILFAGVIAFGSILNTSLVEMMDRVRDTSTLRVLGYRADEVAGIFLRQNIIIFLSSLPVAVVTAYWMMYSTVRAYDTELYRMPMIFQTITVMIGCVIGFGFALLAQWIVLRQMRKLDWLEGIKVKE